MFCIFYLDETAVINLMWHTTTY